MEECKFDEEEEDEIVKRMQIGDIYKSKFIEFSIEMIFCDAIWLREFCEAVQVSGKWLNKWKLLKKHSETKPLYY